MYLPLFLTELHPGALDPDPGFPTEISAQGPFLNFSSQEDRSVIYLTLVLGLFGSSHFGTAKVSFSIHSPFKLTFHFGSILTPAHSTKYCTHYHPLNEFPQSVLSSKVGVQQARSPALELARNQNSPTVPSFSSQHCSQREAVLHQWRRY